MSPSDRRRWRALAVPVVVVAFLVSLPVVAGADDLPLSPSMTVNPVTVAAGDKVTVVGEGWPAGQLVDLSICGNGGDGGSANCNRGGAATVGVGGDGRFGATLVGVIPPVACPCVVRGAAGTYTATQPIQVPGAPLRTAPEAIAVPLVTGLAISGSGPVAAWFGGSPERDVTVTVENPSEGVVKDARVEVRWGSEGSEQSTVVPLAGELEPGAEMAVATTIGLGALTWGDVAVRARVVTTGDPTWVEGETSSYPWGLGLVVLILLQLLVIAVIRRNRRRRREREAELAGATATVPELPAGEQGGELVPSASPMSASSSEQDGPAVAEIGAGIRPVHAITAAPASVPAPVVGPGFGGAAVAVEMIDRMEDEERFLHPTHHLPMTGPVTAAQWTRSRR